MRGAKPAISRNRYIEVRQMREAGLSIEELCSWFKDERTEEPVSHSTIYRILAYCRKRLGKPEQLKNQRRARAHLYGQNTRVDSATSR